MSSLTIGILSKNYAWQRLILGKVAGARYRLLRLLNAYVWLNGFGLLTRYLGLEWYSDEEVYIKSSSRYRPLLPVSVDLLHLFNSVSCSPSRPWILSVESAAPWTFEVRDSIESANPDFSRLRQIAGVRAGVERLADPSCKQLLCLSECTRDIQVELLTAFPEHAQAILAKTSVLHPAQPAQVEKWDKELSPGTPIEFMFIGRDFFRKGGREALLALKELAPHHDLHLTLVSDLRIDNPAFLLEGESRDGWLRWIEDQNWISHHQHMPNAQVLKHLRDAHVGLLPTWMDTYGFSVLECQSAACPVITTSLRALPEINPPEVGWSIPVPTNRLGHPLHGTPAQKHEFSATLRKGLETTLGAILSDPQAIAHKGQLALERIKELHSPAKYSSRLESLYRSAVGK